MQCRDCSTLNERDFFSRDLFYDSRTIAPEKNCPPTPRLILSQTLALTDGQFSSRAIAWLPPNPKTNPNLDPNPNPNRGAIFLEVQLSGYRAICSEIVLISENKILLFLIKSSLKYLFVSINHDCPPRTSNFLGTGRKLNVLKTFRRHPGAFLNIFM